MELHEKVANKLKEEGFNLKYLDKIIKSGAFYEFVRTTSEVIKNIDIKLTHEDIASELCKDCNIFYKDSLEIIKSSNDIRRDYEVACKLVKNGIGINEIKKIIFIMNK